MLTERAFKQGSLCVVGNINRDVKAAPLAPGEYLSSRPSAAAAQTAPAPQRPLAPQ